MPTFAEKFLKYSHRIFYWVWNVTSFVILFFFFIGIVIVITQKPELQAFLWISLIVFAPLITIVIPLTFLTFIISLIVYASKFGIKQSFNELYAYILTIKNLFLSPKKNISRLILFIMSSCLLIIGIFFIGYVYIDWVLKDWIYRTLCDLHIHC